MTNCEFCNKKAEYFYKQKKKEIHTCFDCGIKNKGSLRLFEINKSENKIKSQVLAYCKTKEITVIILDNENKRAGKQVQKGLPDLQLLKNGKVLFMELKAIETASKTYAEQVEWRKVLYNEGFKSVIAFGLDDAMRFIDEL